MGLSQRITEVQLWQLVFFDSLRFRQLLYVYSVQTWDLQCFNVFQWITYYIKNLTTAKKCFRNIDIPAVKLSCSLHINVLVQFSNVLIYSQKPNR